MLDDLSDIPNRYPLYEVFFLYMGQIIKGPPSHGPLITTHLADFLELRTCSLTALKVRGLQVKQCMMP